MMPKLAATKLDDLKLRKAKPGTITYT